MENYVEVLSDCKDKVQNRVDAQRQEYAPALKAGILTQEDINRKVEKDIRLIKALTAAIAALSQSAAVLSDSFSDFSDEVRLSYKCPHCGMVYSRKPLLLCYNGCKRRL